MYVVHVSGKDFTQCKLKLNFKLNLDFNLKFKLKFKLVLM